MAVDESTLISEVRVLTNYDAALLSDADLQGVIELAKTEIRAELNDPDLDFFGDNLQAERALFWLVCIFAKVKSGEFDSPHMTISELKIRQPGMDERTGVWFQKFNQHVLAISGSRIGHRLVDRTDRSYNFDN